MQSDLWTGRRTLFLFRKGLEVQGLAITKNSSQAKLCHISVLPSARGRGLGQALMLLALTEMARLGAKDIHVTTGEEVFGQHADYFTSFGFTLTDWHVNRYRKGSSELIWRREVNFDQNNFEWVVNKEGYGILDLNSHSNEDLNGGGYCRLHNGIASSHLTLPDAKSKTFDHSFSRIPNVSQSYVRSVDNDPRESQFWRRDHQSAASPRDAISSNLLWRINSGGCGVFLMTSPSLKTGISGISTGVSLMNKKL
jgi:hypothetical protein